MYTILCLHELHEGVELVGGRDQLREGDVKGAGFVRLPVDELR